MSVQDALEMWLGALDSADDDSSRCLFLGAGFTKATNAEAPLFADFNAELARNLVRAPGFERLSPRVRESIADAIREGTEKKSLDPSEMIEMMDHLSGRGAVANIVFSEPISPRAQRHSQLPYRNQPGDAADSVFRTLAEWQRLFKTTTPLHAALAQPDAPPQIVARLFAEQCVDLVLSMNWDAYVETAAWLSGLRIEHVGSTRQNVQAERGRVLRVYDDRMSSTLAPRRSGQPTLVKIHGGVDGVTNCFSGPITEREARLRRSFLVAASDLTHWGDGASWVNAVVGDALLSRKMLLIGVSGSDPAVFRAFRERSETWRRDAETHARENPRLPHPRFPCYAVDFGPSLRLEGMLASRHPGESETSMHVVQADARSFLRAAYAWLIAQRLVGALRQDKFDLSSASRLSARLKTEVAFVEGVTRPPTPLIDLLCDSIGPGARWAAAAEGRAPFDGSEDPAIMLNPALGRWRYAPWGRDCDLSHLREIAHLVLWFSRREVRVDESTGVVEIPSGDGGGVEAYLPIVWPWAVKVGLGEAGRLELEREFAWPFVPVWGGVSGNLRVILCPDQEPLPGYDPQESRGHDRSSRSKERRDLLSVGGRQIPILHGLNLRREARDD